MVRRTWSSTLSLGSSKNLNAAVIWFSDYQEYLKLQQNVTQLNEWRKDINTESIENPEWARVITDTNDKVLFGIKQDGSVEWYIGVPKPIRDEQAANKHQPSSFSHHPSRVPVHLQSVAALANQLLRSGTSIGANNAEACNAISKADFKSKSFIALKEARESLYWLDLLHRNGYLTDSQFQSIYDDCEELVKVLIHRCKKLDENGSDK